MLFNKFHNGSRYDIAGEGSALTGLAESRAKFQLGRRSSTIRHRQSNLLHDCDLRSYSRDCPNTDIRSLEAPGRCQTRNTSAQYRHHKSYHPHRRDNIEKVRRDEEEARQNEAKEEAQEGLMMLAVRQSSSLDNHRNSAILITTTIPIRRSDTDAVRNR
jgi:hypothetical protein